MTQTFPAGGLGRCKLPSEVRGRAPEANAFWQAKQKGGGISYGVPTKLKGGTHLWFPLCRGEAGLLITPMYGYCCVSFPLVPVVGLFSPIFFLLCLSDLSSHNPPILAVTFLVFCNHRASLSRIFSVISHI